VTSRVVLAIAYGAVHGGSRFMSDRAATVVTS
jgi:hypothetical protein